MKLYTGMIAGIVLVSTAALAGGNPDENDFGVGTRDPLPQAAPVIPDQYKIQREVEAGIFAKPQLKPVITDEPQEEPVQIVRAESESECWAPFSTIAEFFGGECYRDSHFHDPSPVEFSTVETVELRDMTETKDKRFKTHSRKSAKRLAGLLNHYSRHIAKHYGYDDLTAKAKGRKVKVTLSKTVQVPFTVQTRVRNDRASNGRNGGTMGDSNGMRGNDIDSGNW